MSKLKTSQLPPVVLAILKNLNRFKVLVFIVIVAGVYGYVLLQITTLSNAQPTTEQINAQTKPIKTAHIDKTTVRQLQQLQDNSVNVQALFNNARNNPFQE